MTVRRGCRVHLCTWMGTSSMCCSIIARRKQTINPFAISQLITILIELDQLFSLSVSLAVCQSVCLTLDNWHFQFELRIASSSIQTATQTHAERVAIIGNYSVETTHWQYLINRNNGCCRNESAKRCKNYHHESIIQAVFILQCITIQVACAALMIVDMK